jgi:hypothetical protein
LVNLERLGLGILKSPPHGLFMLCEIGLVTNKLRQPAIMSLIFLQVLQRRN